MLQIVITWGIWIKIDWGQLEYYQGVGLFYWVRDQEISIFNYHPTTTLPLENETKSAGNNDMERQRKLIISLGPKYQCRTVMSWSGTFGQFLYPSLDYMFDVNIYNAVKGKELNQKSNKNKYAHTLYETATHNLLRPQNRAGQG